MKRFIASKSKATLTTLLVSSTWVYLPDGYLNAIPQLQTVLLLGLASFLIGMQAISIHSFTAWSLALLLMTCNAASHAQYLSTFLSGVVGLLLVGVAMHTGACIRLNPQRLPWLITGIVIAAFINALQGLLQWLGLADALWQWMIVPEQRGVAFGTFRQPNLYATFINVGVICVLWLVHLRRLTEAMAWVLVTLMVCGVAASGSRTGSLEIVALGLCGLWLARHQPAALTRLMLGAVLMFSVALWMLPTVAQWHGFGFITSAERAQASAQDGRWLIWRNAIELIALRPWTGWGWKELAYAHYITPLTPKFPELVDHAHNLPLQLAVEFGLPIALICCSVIVWGVVCGRPWLRVKSTLGCPPESAQRVYAWLILLLIVGLHSMLEFPLWYADFLFLTGWSLGYLLPTPPREAARYTRWGFRTAKTALLALGVLLAITWQQFGGIMKMGKAPFNDRAAQRAALKYGADAELFRGTVDLATLRLTDVSPANAAFTRTLAERALHYSPEPIVIESLLQSLWYLGDNTALQKHAQLYCAKYPKSYTQWTRLYADPTLVVATGIPPDHCPTANHP